MYWDLYWKQIKEIGSVWWLWIIFENGRRALPVPEQSAAIIAHFLDTDEK